MSSSEQTPFDIVNAWLDAVNDRREERLMELSDPDIEIVGPRGTGHGHALLREWMSHAHVHLEALCVFAAGDRVVVEQHGVWRSVQDGKLIGETDVASEFRVAGGRVARYARYDSVDEALQAAGLAYTDEMV